MKLIVADLSNIEGRIVAYLADEQWKLQAFRDYDAGIGPDLYNVTAGSIIGCDPWTVAKKDRNVYGKIPELALGYGGGVGALQTFAKAYGINMRDQWETIRQNIRPILIEKAQQNYAEWGHRSGIEQVEWTANEAIKLAWRDRHPATRALWYACNDAAVNAIRMPNNVFPAGRHLLFGAVQHKGNLWLLVKLPSGKYLTYFDPRVDAENNVTYMGYGEDDSQSGRVWSRQYTYGGKILENSAQALAGDVLKSSMHPTEAAGYEIVLTVHDEDVTQAPDDPRWSAEGLARIMATPPVWAPDLPLAAAGFESHRYKKED